MRKLLAVFAALIGFSVVAMEADAKRVGGGRSVGMQRQATPQAPRAPAQQAAPAQQHQPQTAPAAAAPKPASGMSRWLGPLAGLAIGAGLASLFMHNGMGGALMGILLLGAIVFGVMMLFRMFRGGRSTQAQPLRYAGADAYGRAEPIGGANPAPAPVFGGGAAAHSVAATTAGDAPANRWPADFDADEFARHSKANFLKLQEANDRRDIAALRDFMTPTLLREIETDIRAGGDAPQKTEVVTLDAQVVDFETEADQYVVSVRFSGLIREAPGTEPQPFSEVWHLQKPLNGRSGWLVAGIQQA